MGHHLDLHRDGHAQQAKRQNRDKASDKNGAKRRVSFQQAEIEQPGIVGSLQRLVVIFNTLFTVGHATIAE